MKTGWHVPRLTVIAGLLALALGVISMACFMGDDAVGAGVFFVIAASVLGLIAWHRLVTFQALSPEGKHLAIQAEKDAVNRAAHGPRNPAMICPHCQNKGEVRTKPTERNTGVSGAKVVGAVLFSPLALLVTGLSSTEGATQARCGACTSAWVF